MQIFSKKNIFTNNNFRGGAKVDEKVKVHEKARKFKSPKHDFGGQKIKIQKKF